MGRKFISLREVGRRLDIPPSTVVYYKDKFEKFIPVEGGDGRRARYPVEVLEIFRRIRKMFNDNWSTEQIERELALKFGVLMDDSRFDQPIEQNVSSRVVQEFAGVLSGMGDLLNDQSLFRSEIRSLRDEVAALRAERDADAAKQEEAVRSLREEIASLKRRLSARERGGTINFPSAEFLSSPLVIASGGEYLGVQGKGHKHFSLEDFVQLIERKESDTVAVETSWKRQDDHWTLDVRTEDSGSGREQNIVLEARKTVTPSRNTVTEIIRLNIDGNDAPDALLLTLFRQLKSVFNG
ncbi:MerR family transcriptional regulator [Pseudodesulfovibrio thermohalotolerans]|uniref:MerR family transcriptional regulator n=1 Tax=Pseudodesulfovibrio thermohalotolerans TaxID=2880651 RepID=UPI0022B9E02E|nr:MerR family transcriptional regulator [Pseudodesulfovibrio thermohalotolerans]WFS64058.1 MerR family transcriptional regulator [Pseudodesulfovibrio thermohalotolerans]